MENQRKKSQKMLRDGLKLIKQLDALFAKKIRITELLTSAVSINQKT